MQVPGLPPILAHLPWVFAGAPAVPSARNATRGCWPPLISLPHGSLEGLTPQLRVGWSLTLPVLSPWALTRPCSAQIMQGTQGGGPVGWMWQCWGSERSSAQAEGDALATQQARLSFPTSSCQSDCCICCSTSSGQARQRCALPLRPSAGWHGPRVWRRCWQAETALLRDRLEMERGTDGPGGEEFPQRHERVLGIYSPQHDLPARATPFPALTASSGPAPPFPSPQPSDPERFSFRVTA